MSNTNPAKNSHKLGPSFERRCCITHSDEKGARRVSGVRLSRLQDCRGKLALRNWLHRHSCTLGSQTPDPSVGPEPLCRPQLKNFGLVQKRSFLGNTGRYGFGLWRRVWGLASKSARMPTKRASKGRRRRQSCSLESLTPETLRHSCTLGSQTPDPSCTLSVRVGYARLENCLAWGLHYMMQRGELPCIAGYLPAPFSQEKSLFLAMFQQESNLLLRSNATR